MGEIAARLVDALTMFWQSLDEKEQRLLLLGGTYVLAAIVLTPIERRRREQQAEELAERVARRLEARNYG